MLISDNSDLIYYHFHQFNLLENNRFDWCSDFYKKQGFIEKEIITLVEKTA